MLGHLYLRMGQFGRVRKLTMALLALDPDDTWARRCLAVALLKEGDAERALEQLNILLSGRAPALARRRAVSCQGTGPVAGRPRR